ncbi:MAG TPA: sigma 54-interacting transcriptional regulator [Chthoniobacteraceae bacterium]|jgi:transcriptional regulator with GAF, ATPase, and Fis domain|nr:sigma 54-interacting transcriptional regulator [Chthoniobacteraceae bacterium]
MKPTSDSRFDSRFDTSFDPNYAVQMLLVAAHERSLDHLLKKLSALAVARPDIAFVQMWLLDKTDGCLHLAMADGSVPPGANEAATSIPVGTGRLGEVAATGQVITRRKGDAEWKALADAAWLKRERIESFVVLPIAFKDEVLGVMAAFLRHAMLAESLPYGAMFGSYIGAAVANARAFEEIQRLKTQLEQQNAYLEEEVLEARAFGDLIGQSGALRQLVSQLDLVAPTEASVLIQGETGTGKELVAREIHRRSARRDKPLVRVNCASIPKELFESEFFGHVRGSFTGAIKDRAGRFETAEGGTLFLDEIGEVPLEMQGKLLRVLQEKRYERVGEDRTRTASVRIVAATNRDLKKEVAAGRFREDLYYRLHVFPIQVIPLRERKDDIPLLARHFVELSVKELKCAQPRLTKAGVARLQCYDWPGNVRELRNVIERAVILARGGGLEFDLPLQTAASAAPGLQSRSETAAVEADEPPFLTEAELQLRERDNLLRILRKTHWKIKGPDGAAETLGVKPTTLLSRMEKWGLKKPGAT